MVPNVGLTRPSLVTRGDSQTSHADTYVKYMVCMLCRVRNLYWVRLHFVQIYENEDINNFIDFFKYPGVA